METPEYPPVAIEIGGRVHTFTYEGTTCNIYRISTDTVHNHIVNEEYGSQRVFLFGVPRVIMYLSGIDQPNHGGLKEKEASKVMREMDERFGWNAKTVIEDKAPVEVTERHIKLASKVLQASQVFVPKEWA